MNVLQGDSLQVLRSLPSGSVQMCVTSPPYYGLRDYGVDGQIGLEETPEQYIEKLVDVFREVRRVLKDDGTLWVNIGDSYAARTDGHAPTNTRNKNGHTKKHIPEGYKPKDLIGIPWMLAFALRADGWYLRQDIIWQKTDPMPESVKDRCTKSHEYIFLLAKSQKYYFDYEAIREDTGKVNNRARAFGAKKQTGTMRNDIGTVYCGDNGKRNKRDVWTTPVASYSGAHFATFPENLIKPCILAGSREGDLVLDPFNGAATTGVVCKRLKRDYIGVELNPEYVKLSLERLEKTDVEVYMEQNQCSLFEGTEGDS